MSNKQDHFDSLLADADSIDVDAELAEQRLTQAEIEESLREARRKREARYEQAVQRLENDGTPEVLTLDD